MDKSRKRGAVDRLHAFFTVVSTAGRDRSCQCPSIWCRLDNALRCKVRWICDKHERAITG